ncbi:MAG: CoA-binding protein [Chitinophagaceae bacterium]
MNNQTPKTTLVVGASENVNRYSNMAMKLLKTYGHPVLALGKQKGEVDGIPIETLSNCFENSQIDTITLYLNPQNQVKYYQELINLKPKRVIFNPGTENEEFEQKLRANNIETEEACTLVLLRSGQF